jgi:HPt (histidine-containing phosphotransfer) domain-containing protein
MAAGNDTGNSHSPQSAFDLPTLLENAGGDSSLTTELIQLCLTEAPLLLAQIRTAVDAFDANALRFAAHTLKGALMNFGARRAVNAAFQLESAGREQSLQNVADQFRELESAWSELERELKAYLQ